MSLILLIEARNNGYKYNFNNLVIIFVITNNDIVRGCRSLLWMRRKNDDKRRSKKRGIRGCNVNVDVKQRYSIFVSTLT